MSSRRIDSALRHSCCNRSRDIESYKTSLSSCNLTTVSGASDRVDDTCTCAAAAAAAELTPRVPVVEGSAGKMTCRIVSCEGLYEHKHGTA